MARKKEIISLVIVAFILGIVVLCFFPISHSYLNKKTVEIFQKKGILDSCAVRKVSLTIFRGLLIHDLLCIRKIDMNRSIRIEIPFIRIDYRLLRAVDNWKEIESSLKGADRNSRKYKLINRRYLLGYLYSTLFKADTLLLPCVKSVIFDRARMTIDSLGKEMASGEKVSGTIHVNEDDPSILKIMLSANKMESNGIHALKLKASIELDGPHCVIKKISCISYGGKLNAEFDLNLQHNRINKATINLKKAELEKVYSSLKKDEGFLKGKCSFTFDLDTSIIEFNSLKGTGKIKLSKVSAVNIPLITKIALLLDITKLSHLTFKKINGDVSINGEKLFIDSLEGDGDPLSLNMAGWVTPEKRYFHFKVGGVFESYYKDSISYIAWNILIPEEDGRRSFFCTIYGTPDYPSVSLDRKLMRRAAKNFFKGIREDLKSIFRKRK